MQRYKWMQCSIISDWNFPSFTQTQKTSAWPSDCISHVDGFQLLQLMSCVLKKEQINYLKTRANAKDSNVRVDTHMYVNMCCCTYTCIWNQCTWCVTALCLPWHWYVFVCGLPAMWVAKVTVAISFCLFWGTSILNHIFSVSVIWFYHLRKIFHFKFLDLNLRWFMFYAARAEF